MTLGHTTPQTCFIIAPITTPEERITLYQNDANHCRHVIEHLLVPAVEKAGFKPLLPIAEGSHLIHAEVIRHLREADLVLCDMSGLNANVFFEVGIRTAQNKPVCLTKDKQTPIIPFDTMPINTHTYDGRPDVWKLQDEIDALAKHVQSSSLLKINPLWEYLGLRLSPEQDFLRVIKRMQHVTGEQRILKLFGGFDAIFTMWDENPTTLGEYVDGLVRAVMSDAFDTAVDELHDEPGRPNDNL